MGGGHGGSRPHLVHAFLQACLGQRPGLMPERRKRPSTGRWSGYCAHQSALQGGEIDTSFRGSESWTSPATDGTERTDRRRFLIRVVRACRGFDLLPNVAHVGHPAARERLGQPQVAHVVAILHPARDSADPLRLQELSGQVFLETRARCCECAPSASRLLSQAPQARLFDSSTALESASRWAFR